MWVEPLATPERTRNALYFFRHLLPGEQFHPQVKAFGCHWICFNLAPKFCCLPWIVMCFEGCREEWHTYWALMPSVKKGWTQLLYLSIRLKICSEYLFLLHWGLWLRHCLMYIQDRTECRYRACSEGRASFPMGILEVSWKYHFRWYLEEF